MGSRSNVRLYCFNFVKQCKLCMRLGFPKDKVADEVACIVWAYKGAFFPTKSRLLTTSYSTHSFLFFWHANTFPVSRFAIYIEILRRLHKVIASSSPVSIYYFRLIYKVLDKIVRLTVWILHD